MFRLFYRSTTVRETDATDREYQNQGWTTILVSVNSTVLGFVGIADKIKEQAPYALKLLREMGLETIMLTGDHIQTAKSIGEELGFDENHIIAQVLPNEKAYNIKNLTIERSKL